MPNQQGLHPQPELSQSANIASWARLLSELYGTVKVDARGSEIIQGHVITKEMWQLKLCHIEMSRHRIAVPPALARPGTHSLNLVRFQTVGRTVFEQGELSIALEAGDCIVYNLTRPHSFTSLETTAYDAVIIPNALVRLQSVPVELLRAKKISRDEQDDVALFAHHLVETFLKAPATLRQAAAASLAHGLITLLNSCFSQGIVTTNGFTRSAMMRELADLYIRDHLRENDLDVGQISAALGCSKRHLHAIFQEKGTSIQRHIWRLRVENCRAELESPASEGKSITNVAFSWGFSSAAHFSRLFKAHFGYSPSALRKPDRSRLLPRG